MLNALTSSSNASDTKQAVSEVVEKIKQNANLVIYFSSVKYDFKLLSKMMKDAFPTSEVIGCTSCGEFGCGGFREGLIAVSIAADDFTPSTVVVKDIKQKAILAKKDIQKAFEKTGLSLTDPDVSKKGFAITLIEAMVCAEEKVMTVLNSLFKDLKFPIVGGSAGDINVKQTFVSCNGEVYENAAVITFVKTGKKFFTYKENIYHPTDIEFKATKVDMEKRVVYEFNGKPAAQFYADVLGVTKSELTSDHFATNPVGRVYGDNIWITTPMDIYENEAIKFYAQLMQGATVRLLKASDTVAEARKTAQEVNKNIPSAKLVLGFSCLLRYVQFSKEKSTEAIYKELSAMNGNLVGFNCLGEQYYSQHVNQTLSLIAIGE